MMVALPLCHAYLHSLGRIWVSFSGVPQPLLRGSVSEERDDSVTVACSVLGLPAQKASSDGGVNIMDRHLLDSHCKIHSSS